MTVHSRLNPSSSHRWSLCPGSVKMADKVVETTSRAATEGTMLHEVMTAFLKGETRTVSEEHQELIDFCLAEVEQIKGIRLYETRVRYDAVCKGQSGTADLIAYDPIMETLTIIDYKFGMGRVEAENNTQLILYLIGALEIVEMFGYPPPKEMILMILQPKLNVVDTWSLNYITLAEKTKELREAAEWAMKAFNAPDSSLESYLVPGEEQCQWCPALGFCRVAKEYNIEQITAGFDDIVPTTLTKLSPQEIAKILDGRKTFNAWIDAVEKYAYKMLDDGAEIPGWMLGEGRTSRIWMNEQQAAAMLEALLPKQKIYKESMISPAAAEKILGKKAIAGLVFSSRGKMTLKKGKDHGCNLNGFD